MISLALLGGIMAHAESPAAEEISSGGLYSVIEFIFHGPQQDPTDVPARDIDFWAMFRHESGVPEYKIHGFWDGDGKGGISGDVFKIRFCPTKIGRWDLVQVHSNIAKLSGQRQGEHIVVTSSDHPGFWVADPDSPGQRWYMRSDGTHQYIFGNTHYSFLSGYKIGNEPAGNNIADDVRANIEYFRKLRFTLNGDRYPHPTVKPFFDSSGNPTDDGDYSHRQNPKWFHQRADLAVRTAYDVDLIADLILAGPDAEDSRAILRASHNDGDPTPFLKYVAARYGSYPNVWICLCNEFDIKQAQYSFEEIVRFGQVISEFLPYPTPLSVHSSGRRGWYKEFDDLPPWNDHQIIQKKLKSIASSADAIYAAWEGTEDKGSRNKPTINDELSYEGLGDKHTWDDTVESHLGAFLGGGYGTTGEKPGNKTGQYFRGKFDPTEHTSAVNLGWLRDVIDANITFWKMASDLSIFSNLDPGSRGMAWPENEYVLGTDKLHDGIVAHLPTGTWTVSQYDVIAREAKTLSNQASGDFTFTAPDSRAVLFHFKKNE